MGTVKILVLANFSELLAYDSEYIYTSRKKLRISSVMSVMSFRFHPVLKLFKVPTVVVNKDFLVFRTYNESGPLVSKEALKRIALRNLDIAVRVARSCEPGYNFADVDVLKSFLKVESLLTSSFYGFLSLYSGLVHRFGSLLSEELILGNIKLKLYEVFLLPAVCYGVLKEVKGVLEERLKPFSEPQECINACLSYGVGDPYFSILLAKSLSGLEDVFLKEDNLSKAHGNLSSHTRKLRKAREGAEPLNLFGSKVF